MPWSCGVSASEMRDLYHALGQFILYRAALALEEPERELFLAMRATSSFRLFDPPEGQLVLARESIRLLVCDLDHQEAEVFQRSSSTVEGRNRYLSLRLYLLRGLAYPRKRACLTAGHNFFLTRADGTTAAERFFGQKPRCMFAVILASVELPPVPLRPPRRALGEAS